MGFEKIYKEGINGPAPLLPLKHHDSFSSFQIFPSPLLSISPTLEEENPNTIFLPTKHHFRSSKDWRFKNTLWERIAC